MWRDSLDQPVVASAGNKPLLRTCGQPVSQSSSKHHSLQDRRRFREDVLIHAGQRTRPTTTQKEMESNRRWVPRLRSPEDGKFCGVSPGNTVVRLRTGPVKRSADPPQGTVHMMGPRRGLSSQPRLEIGGALRKVVHQSRPNRPQSPWMLTRKTKNLLGVQAGQSRRNRLHQSSGAQGREEGSKDDPESSPPGHVPLAHKTLKWSMP